MTAPPARRCLVLTDDGIIDPVAVEIAARGIRAVALTRAERQLAAVGILARGGTPYMVAKRLHASGTTALTLAAESAHRARRNEQSPPPGRGAVAVPRGRRDRRRDQPAEPAPGNAGPEVITMATGASVPCPCRCVARTGMHSRRRQAAQAAGGQR